MNILSVVEAATSHRLADVTALDDHASNRSSLDCRVKSKSLIRNNYIYIYYTYLYILLFTHNTSSLQVQTLLQK